MPDLYVDKWDDGSWRVMCDGKPVSGSHNCEALADVALGRMEARARLKKRKCMTCGQPFKSEGPHNRMCGKCRGRKSEWF